MKQEIECPNCGNVFEAIVWESGECEYCGLIYCWDELQIEDDDLSVPSVDWSS